jgi:uncharacterized membrane protein YdfJ with MMPL/SSD domain
VFFFIVLFTVVIHKRLPKSISLSPGWSRSIGLPEWKQIQRRCYPWNILYRLGCCGKGIGAHFIIFVAAFLVTAQRFAHTVMLFWVVFLIVSNDVSAVLRML